MNEARPAVDIFLVRHAEAAASYECASDPGLSALGVEQARAAARDLQARVGSGTRLLSSPLARARDTAAPLAAVLGTPVRVDEAFREIPSPVPLVQRKRWLRQFMRQDWRDQPPDLCQWRDSAWQRLLQLCEPAVVYTHFLLINAVVGQLLGRTETLIFWPDNASITRLRHTGTRLELVALGREMTTAVN